MPKMVIVGFLKKQSDRIKKAVRAVTRGIRITVVPKESKGPVWFKAQNTYICGGPYVAYADLDGDTQIRVSTAVEKCVKKMKYWD